MSDATSRRPLRRQRSIQEFRDVVEHLVAVGLVEDLVTRSRIDAFLDAAPAQALDRCACQGQRAEGVLGPVDPQRGQRAEIPAVGDAIDCRSEALRASVV